MRFLCGASCHPVLRPPSVPLHIFFLYCKVQLFLWVFFFFLFESGGSSFGLSHIPLSLPPPLASLVSLLATTTPPTQPTLPVSSAHSITASFNAAHKTPPTCCLQVPPPPPRRCSRTPSVHIKLCHVSVEMEEKKKKKALRYLYLNQRICLDVT